MVFGGPPCPGFSNIGRSKISSLIKSGEWEGSDHRHKFIDDERNELFREFVKYVEHFQPQVFVMENVKGMKSYETKKHGTIVDIIEAEFRRLGYEVEVDVMDSSGFGVAQNRQRLIFLGTRKASKLTHPHPTAWAISLSDVIADLPSIDPLTGASTGELLEPFKNVRGSKRRKQVLRYLRKQALPRPRPRNFGTLQEHRTQGQSLDQAIFPLLRSGENGPRVCTNMSTLTCSSWSRKTFQRATQWLERGRSTLSQKRRTRQSGSGTTPHRSATRCVGSKSVNQAPRSWRIWPKTVHVRASHRRSHHLNTRSRTDSTSRIV